MDKFVFCCCLVFFCCLYTCDEVYTKRFSDKSYTDNNECDKKAKELRIKGENVKFSEFTNDNGRLKTNICDFVIQKLSIFASSQVVIDKDFKSEGFLEMFVLAPTWNIINTRKLVLKGKTGTKAIYERRRPRFGYDGKSGFPGTPGGNFFGVGDEFVNGKGLTINVEGGDGSDGLNGGDGEDGEHGLYADKDRLTLFCGWIPSCHEGDKFFNLKPDRVVVALARRLDSSLNFIHTFKCSGIDISWLKYCNFKIKGKSGRPSMSGGNGGEGGKPGHPGNIKIVELTKKSEFKLIQHFGKTGRDGKGGKAGKPGSNGKDVLHYITVKKKAWYLFSTEDKVTLNEYLDGPPMTNGVDGKDGFISSLSADSQKEIDSSETANKILDYKEYLREVFHDDEDTRVQFYNKVENNENILILYGVLAFVRELKSLEKQYHRLNGRLNFLNLYKSLSNRTSEYAMKPNSESRSSMQHKKVLTFLYTTIMIREYNLKDRSESNLIVEMAKYLDHVTQNIHKYKAASRVTTMEMYRSNYVENIGSKIDEANHLIQRVILPEIDKAVGENQINVENLLDEIIRLQKKSDARVEELKKAKRELESKLHLSLACDALSAITSFIPLILPFGNLIATGIDTANMFFKEGMGLNDEVDGPYTIKPPVQVEEIEKAFGRLLKNDIDSLRRRIEFIVDELNKNPKELGDLLKQVKTIRGKIDQVKNREGVRVLKEELKRAIEEKQASLKTKSLNNRNFLQLKYNKNRGTSFSINKILTKKRKKKKMMTMMRMRLKKSWTK